MMITEAGNVTELLIAWRNGDRSALDQLVDRVYDVLHRLARTRLRGERRNHSMQPTVLVNEAYLRLMNQREIDWQSRAHFFGVAAHLMRNILIDYARTQQSCKRQGARESITLENIPSPAPGGRVDLLELDRVLSELALLDAQKSRIVELRYFAGLTIEETAEALGISTGTVKREWNVAKAWLFKQLSENR